MVEILSPVDLNKWLSDKPQKFGQFIAYRAACRHFIEIDEFVALDGINQEIKSDLILNLVRALIISEVALSETDTAIKEATITALSSLAKTITKINEIDLEIISNSNFFTQKSNSLDEDIHFSSKLATGALRIVRQSLTAITMSGLTNRSASAAFVVAEEADEIKFEAIKEDINFLIENNDDLSLRQSKIFSGGFTLLNASQYQGLKKLLLRSGVNWQFWIDWYQSKLDGTLHPGLTRAQQEALYYKIATFPNELWEESAESVNQRIAELLEVIKIGVITAAPGTPIFEEVGDLGADLSSETITHSSTSKSEQFRTLINSPKFRSNVEQNKVAISFACAGVILQVEEYKKQLEDQIA